MGKLSDERLRAIAERERGIPQAHEIAELLDHIDALTADLAAANGGIMTLTREHSMETGKLRIDLAACRAENLALFKGNAKAMAALQEQHAHEVTACCERLQQELARVTAERDRIHAEWQRALRLLEEAQEWVAKTAAPVFILPNAELARYRDLWTSAEHELAAYRGPAQPPGAGGGERTKWPEVNVGDSSRVRAAQGKPVDPAPAPATAGGAEKCGTCGGTRFVDYGLEDANDEPILQQCRTCHGIGTAPGKAP